MAEPLACRQLPFPEDSPVQSLSPGYFGVPTVGSGDWRLTCSAARKHHCRCSVTGPLGRGRNPGNFLAHSFFQRCLVTQMGLQPQEGPVPADAAWDPTLEPSRASPPPGLEGLPE